MTTGGEFVVITPSHTRKPANHRTSLTHLTIPKQSISDWETVSLPRGWWVGVRGSKLILQARFSVEEVRVERDLRNGAERVVWELDIDESERIAWQWGPSPSRLDVTRCLANAGLRPSAQFITARLSDDIVAKLNGKLSSSAQVAITYDVAATHVARLMRATGSERPVIQPAPISLRDALVYVRSYFARSELFDVEGCDPFFVAAAAIAGFTSLPERPQQSFRSGGSMPVFREFESSRDIVVERKLCHDDSDHARQKLVVATQRHEDIVAALAEVIRNAGFQPTYNNLVDLRVDRGGDELFFEVKTADEGNLLEQTRAAVGQLLEYRCRYRRRMPDKSVRLVAVLEDVGDIWQGGLAREMLEDVGIYLIRWDSNEETFASVRQVLTRQFQPGLPPEHRSPG